MKLDQTGIFRAAPLSWGLGQASDNSKATPVVIEFAIVAKLEDKTWTDWTQFEEQTITGYFYITKKDGSINTAQVEQLAKALGWNGDPASLTKRVPEVLVQITVEQEVYNDRAQLKIKWINHGDFVPGPTLQDEKSVESFRSVFGSQMRACASAATKGAPAPVMAPPRATTQPMPEQPEDGLPF